MYGCGTITISSACQIDCHAPVAVNPIVTVIDIFNLRQNFCFFGIIISLPVFTVVVIGIWTYGKPPEQPTDAEFFLIFIYESISR